MITAYLKFSIPTPPGLHQRSDRAELVEAIRLATGGAELDRVRHSVRIHLCGDWKDSNQRNTDNVVKNLLDAMAEAFGLGKRGRGDNYLDRDYSVKATDAETEWVEIEVSQV